MADDNVTPIRPSKRKRAPRKPKPPDVASAKTVVVPAHDPGAEEHRLRLLGKTWTQIANELGHASPALAQATRARFLERAGLALSREKRAEALNLEIERLDTIQASYWELAIAGAERFDGLPRTPDVKAAEVVLKIISQRSKLLGLEEADRSAQGPRTVVITGDAEQYVATLKQLIEGNVEDAELVDE